MKIVCISDTHSLHDKLFIPESDMIIHAGDCTNTGTTKQIREFCEWYGELDQEYKILIAGNHDWGFQEKRTKHEKICEEHGIIYLQDSSVIIEGIKIYGSPQTPEFCDWAFNCWRLENQETQNLLYGHNYPWIGHFWKKIPDDTDILITHGPPYNIMDLCGNGNVGCELLLKRVKEVKPKYHIFGHIHEHHGIDDYDSKTTFINAAQLNDRYDVTYKPIEIEYDEI